MIYNINNSVLSLKVKHCMFSMLELAALVEWTVFTTATALAVNGAAQCPFDYGV